MSFTTLASGGVQLDRTRILIEDGKTSASYGLQNHYDVPVLASSEITNFDGTPSSALAVTPALFQVKPNKTTKGKVTLLQKLPSDRESVFWLNVKTILPSSKEEDSKSKDAALEIAIAQRIKVFYRPKGLEGNSILAARSLSFSRDGNLLKVKNPSNMSVSLVAVQGEKGLQKIGDVVMPFETKNFKLESSITNVNKFTFVDEYGNFITEDLTKKRTQ